MQNDAGGEVTFRHAFQSGLAQKTGWGNPPDSAPPNDIDPLHQCFHEVMPTTIDAMGSKFYVQDNSETPDTMLATFLYPKSLASYENRTCNPLPMSEIETCVRSSAVCILANVAMRSKVRLDWDEDNWTVAQDAARPMLKEKYRAPWKLEVWFYGAICCAGAIGAAGSIIGACALSLPRSPCCRWPCPRRICRRWDSPTCTNHPP